MASKQIGKLKQRVGEIVSRSQNKTSLADGFKELEADMQLRGAGLERLTVAADAYIKSLMKKTEVNSSAGKLLPREELGTVMMGHGEDFGRESVYGTALVNFGRVHCKLSILQEDYATALQDTYITTLQDEIAAIKEYQALRKKLESRRLALDSYISKAAKTKKEKDKAEAEEELELARARYGEMAEEVEDRMLSIQKREADQFAELTGFLETELAYAAAYHNTLLKVKEEWPDAALTNNPKLTHRRSIISVREPALVTVARVSTDADHLVPMRTRANTANGATPAASSQSRKRSDSLATTGTNASATTGCSGNPSSTLRENVGGWMGSLSRRKSSISKKNFQSLDDSEDKWPTPSNSFRQRKPPAPPVRRSSRVFRRSNLARIRALHDFTAVAPDELAFRVGDILTVLDENVPQGANMWVRAEKDGMVGLIPMNYFETAPSSPAKVASRNPSIRRQPSGYNSSPEHETEQRDSPSSSLLQDILITRQNSAQSRSGKGSADGGKATSSPEIQMYYYDGMEEPWAESTSSLGLDPGDEDYDYPMVKGAATLPPPGDLWLAQQEMDRKERKRKVQTAPPSPSRYPVPAPSPHQLASNIAQVVAAKKPPPPPPPPRRSQSSTQVGSLVSSNAGRQAGSAAADNAPPTLPPFYNRPPIPERAPTAHEDHGHGVSPFGS